MFLKFLCNIRVDDKEREGDLNLQEMIVEYYNKIESGRPSLEESPIYDKERFEKIILEVKESCSVLDLGCGSGILGEFLNKRNKYVGLDINKNYLKNLHFKGIEGILGVVEHLPFADKVFDVVICAEVLEHVFNPKIVLENIHKILKRNGKVIVSVPNVAYWDYRKELLFGRFPENKSEVYPPEHIRFFTKDDIMQLMANSGFRCIKVDIIRNRVPLQYLLPRFIQDKLCSSFPTLMAWQFIVVGEKI
ncbi:MAG: class I SAM-dependent methyltransferase [Methanocellales archaeon]|nr:class I SAM-dependent methyltransferase [Methanocellales archaeon]